MILIGLVGKKNSGKTTVADYLAEKYSFTKISIADPLKQMIVKAGLASYEEVYKTKPPYVRELLQKIGTDIFRKQVDDNFWVKKCIVRIG